MTDPTRAAQILRQLQAQNARPTFDPYDLEDENTTIVGPGRAATDDDLRPDIIQKRIALAQLQRLQGQNSLIEQQHELNDPSARRERMAQDADYETGLIGSGALDAPEAHAQKMVADKILGEKRAANTAQVELEDNPVHRGFVREQQQSALEGKLAPIELRAALSGDHMTAQTRQMSEQAQDVMTQIPKVRAQAEELKQLGLFAPGIGSVRNFLASHGMGGLVGMGPDVANKIGHFNTDMGLLVSAIQRAHAGARGAGNKAMTERFEQLLNNAGDINTFMGSLEGAEDWMQMYAGHAAPQQRQSGMFSRGIK